MTWLFQLVCGIAGHATPIPMSYTKRRKLCDENNNPTGFVIVTETKFLQCSRCNRCMMEYKPEKTKVVRDQT